MRVSVWLLVRRFGPLFERESSHKAFDSELMIQDYIPDREGRRGEESSAIDWNCFVQIRNSIRCRATLLRLFYQWTKTSKLTGVLF